MKAAYLKKPWEISITDIEEPSTFGKEMALVRVTAAGICGSDLGAYRGTNSLVSYPRIIGHELAGEILEIEEDNPKGLSVGDHVIVDPYLYCGKCYPCSIGRTNCCVNLQVLGVHVDGGMVERFLHPADMLVKIPDEMDWVLASMAEPLTISLHGLHRVRLKAGEHIAIFGAGTIGLLAAMGAIHYGAVPILIDLVAERLEFARQIGVTHTIDLNRENLVDRVRAFTDGRFVECVMEASGANSAIRSTFDIVSHAGRIAFTGWPKEETLLPTDVITRKELDIVGARTSVNEFEEAIELINSKHIAVEKLITRTISLEQIPEILEEIHKNPGAFLKVVVCIT